MAGPKSVLEAKRFVQKRCTYQRPKSPRKVIEPRVLEKKGLFIYGHIYLCKQLLPQINSCCQEVMQNNETTSSWSNHYWMLVASRKTCWLWILSPRTVPNLSVYRPDHHFQDQWLGVERCYLIFLHPTVGVSRSVWWFKYGN